MIHQDRYIERTPGRAVSAVRLLVITPVDPVDGKEGPFPVTSRERDFLLPQTTVDEVLCKGAPAQICGEGAVAKVIPMIAGKAKWGESSGYDAVVINCMVDPGVKEVQRQLKIPVIGAGRAATGLATTVGDHPARIFPNCVHVNELAARQEDALQELQTVSLRKVKTRGVDALVFNCAYLGGASNYLQDKVGVPVMATTEIALRAAETIVLLGILPVRPEVEASRVSNFRQTIYRMKDGFHHLKGVLKQVTGRTLRKMTE